jgi:protein required for attachment to host cells
MGAERHALGTAIDPHEHELKIFARQLSDFLEHAAAQESFDELAVIAPPHFLGELKLILPAIVRKFITREISKDLPITSNNKERINHICKYLDLWNHNP